MISIPHEDIINQIKDTTDPVRKAQLMYYARREREMRITDIAKYIGMQPAAVSQMIRINRLPEIIIDGYYAKSISLAHLFVISRLKDQSVALATYERVLTENLTVIQTEEVVRFILHDIKTKGEYMSKEEIAMFARRIQELYGDVGVKVIQTRINAKIILQKKGNVEKTSQLLRKAMHRLAPPSRGSKGASISSLDWYGEVEGEGS